MAYERKTADILISDELREILKEIETESVVASLLLKKRHKKEDLVEDFVSYIAISRDDRSKIAYLSNDRKDKIDESEYWTSPRRYQSKPGGFVGKVFKNIEPKDIEKFANLYRAETMKPSFTFKVVSGDDIKWFYDIESYVSEKGTLGASCMKYEHCQPYFGLYTDNKEVSLLVMLNSSDELMGRSLLWNFDSNKIMDRIYTINDDELQFHFKKWASDNDYLYKSQQNWYNSLYFENHKTPKKEYRFDIKLENINHFYFPYVDTFKFIDFNSKTISNYITCSDNINTLCTTDGSYYDGYFLGFDSIKRVFSNRCELKHLKYLDILTNHNNIRYSSINNCYILIDDSIYDDIIDDYIFCEDLDHHNNERVKELREKIINKKNLLRNELNDIKSEDLTRTLLHRLSESINDVIVDDLPF